MENEEQVISMATEAIRALSINQKSLQWIPGTTISKISKSARDG